MKKFIRSITAAFFTATLGSSFDWVVPAASLPLRRPLRVRNLLPRDEHAAGAESRSDHDPAK